MYDRESLYPGRVQLKDVETGETRKYDLTMADEATQEGTPPTKANLLQDETCDVIGIPTTSVVDDALKTIGSRAPIGTILWYASQNVPNGYLICDGSEISRTDYADLFSVIGTTFGSGDGTTTFLIPDLRAAFIRGSGTNGTYSANFGAKQQATRIPVTMYNGQMSGILTTLGISNNDSLTGGGTRYSMGGTAGDVNYSVAGVRPYNIALTPIIKY